MHNFYFILTIEKMLVIRSIHCLNLKDIYGCFILYLIVNPNKLIENPQITYSARMTL